jgi:hypothetical protein
MESCNGRSSRAALRHVHESKAIRAARLAVGHHIDRVYDTIQLEELAEVLIGHEARKVANKNVHTKVLLGSVLSRSPEYGKSMQKQYSGETAKDHPGSLEYVLLSRVMRKTIPQWNASRSVLFYGVKT